MAPPCDEIPDAAPPCSDTSDEDHVAPRPGVLPDGLFLKQLRSAELEAAAERIAAGGDLDIDNAVALSCASLPLLGKLVEMLPGMCDRDKSATALPVERATALPELPQLVGQPLTDWESFCQALIVMRAQLASNGGEAAWYPVVTELLDQGCGADVTGAEVLRAIAVARLVLPVEVQVWAPLVTLGPKLAQVALEFGASHLGYAAPDGEPANDPFVANAGALDELLASVAETPLQL